MLESYLAIHEYVISIVFFLSYICFGVCVYFHNKIVSSLNAIIHNKDIIIREQKRQLNWTNLTIKEQEEEIDGLEDEVSTLQNQLGLRQKSLENGLKCLEGRLEICKEAINKDLYRVRDRKLNKGEIS